MTPPIPKPGIMDIPLYVPGRAAQEGVRNVIKLSANENALGCSPNAREAYLREAARLSLYPDMHAGALRAAVGAKFDLEPQQLIFGAGSDELFALACHAYLTPGDNIVQPEFGFAAWALVAQAAGGVVKSARESNYRVDVDALLDAVDERTRIVFIANPANPTGTLIPFDDIRRFHAALRPDVLLVLDGAYAEFSGAETEDFVFARSAENILVTRTFSKLYGLASLRLGWGYGAPSVIDALDRVRLPFNTTSAAQAAAIAALDDDDFTMRSINYVEQERSALVSFFTEIGVEVIPSAANFLTVRLGDGAPVTADRVVALLAEEGVLVRGLANYGLADCLRITIGPAEDLERLRASILKILSGVKRSG